MGGIVQSGAYAQYMNEVLAGQISKASIGNNISMVLKDSNVGFGLAVVQGTNDNDAKVPAGAGGKFRGVTVRNLNVNNNDANVGEYLQDTFVTLRNFGTIIVKTEVAVVKDEPVFFRHTASGGNTVIGAFRNDADTATADVITGARFNASAGAGELVEIILPTIY